LQEKEIKTMERLDRIEKLMEELVISQKISQQESDAQFEKLRISQQEITAQMKETDAKFKETDAKFDKIHAELSGIGFSNGDAAEAFFYNSLEAKLELGGVKYDFISKNVKQRKYRKEREYDIFLENGNAVGLVEVKYKVQQNHIEKLISDRVESFRELFPEYADYKLYLGIAGLSYENGAEELAADNGFVILKQKGETVEINSDNMRAF
jgi:hypothetical protein